MSEAFTIEIEQDAPHFLLLRLKGVLDGRSSPMLVARCAPVAAQNRRLILNLAGVSMITSSGIGALLALVEECGQEFGKVRIAAPSQSVLSVIRLLNLHQFLVIDDSEEQSIRAAEAA